MLESLKKRLQKLFRIIFPGTELQEPPQISAAKTNSDKRSFDRYQITFPVRVFGKDARNRDFQEATQLQDVSGSGALFLSSTPDRYHPGQQLVISILLDAAEDVRACIRNEASVVRIHPPAAPGIETGEALQGIAVTFNHAFDFYRMASEENGCSE